MRANLSSTDSAVDLVQHAWRLLLATAAERRRTGRRGELAAVAEPCASWLALAASGAPAASAQAPAAVRALLDLYAPLCAAAVDQPLTIAHLGQSLDGHIATGSGDSYYVTGPDNVRHLHRLRALCDEFGALLLFDVNMGAGHGGASGRFDALKDLALEYAFALACIESPGS